MSRRAARAKGAAYLSFDGHRSGDFTAYVFRTGDFGQTWRSVASNLPRGGTVNVVREVPSAPDVILAGTEFGLWVSPDRGGRWRRVRGKLPTVPVDDIRIHPRDQDLIVGTHGRGVFILDDAASVLKLDEGKDADLHLYEPRTAVQYRIYGHKGNTGHKTFLAPNPPDGALLTYRLKAKPAEKDDVKIVIKDAAGETVRELKGSKDAGLNRTSWDLRHEPPVEAGAGTAAGFFGPPRGPLVPPGSYTATISVGAHVRQPDAHGAGGPAPRGLRGRSPGVVRRGARGRQAVDTGRRAQQDPGVAPEADGGAPGRRGRRTTRSRAEAVTAAAKALADKVEPLAKRVSRQTPLGFAGAPLAADPDPLLGRARGAYLAAGAITAPPTAQQRAAFARLDEGPGRGHCRRQ